MASSSSSSVRSWRTAFLTLRDETLTCPPRTSLHALLQNLVFSQMDSLISAAPDLPPHEITSDVILLVELTKTTLESESVDDIYVHTCHLIHDVSCRVCLEINSSSWTVMLDFIGKMVQYFLGKADAKKVLLANTTRMKSIMEILEILRHLINIYGRKCSSLENTQLVKLLLHVVACCHVELFSLSYSSGNERYNSIDAGARFPKGHKLWEVQTIAFVMIGEALSRIGSSISVELWQSTLKGLRKEMDALAAKGLLIEDNVMSRFYTSLLHCLHLVLSDPKGSLSEHVAGFVAALRMFFIYGLTNRPPLVSPNSSHKEKEFNSPSHNTRLAESTRIEAGPYRPPHLRKREGVRMKPVKARDSQNSSDNEPYAIGFTSSDSEHSDSDGIGKDVDYYRSSKARIAAIICIQDLCVADPKSLTAHWTMLLPTNDVLQPRKYEATLMTCLLFDPVLKAQIASASTLASILGGASSIFLQVAEFKESTKFGSFTALSSSLGQILMQLHTGILHLVQREARSGFLASLFKVLMLLISATPYARMPGELLPAVISSVRLRMIEGFPSNTDKTGLLVIALGCLGAALSTSPPSLQVKEMLQKEISTGLVGAQGKQGVLSLIFEFSEHVSNTTITFESLQVLRAVSHNYPNIMAACWEQVSTIIYGLLRVATPEVPTPVVSTRLLKGDNGERWIIAAVKVLDECLRAISGFKGTEDLLDDRSLDTPFTSDCTRTKRISSAPTYGIDDPEFSRDLTPDSGSKQWSDAIEKHLPMVLFHNSPMVRAASVTCFAGITSSVFFSLMEEKQDFILSSSISAALNDEVPSVRSAACRAIGVIACFPQISHRAEILDKFIHAVVLNTRDPLFSVRITASWALANICDSVRRRASDRNSENCSTDLKTDSHWIALLAECALRLAKDGDKIKSNAVRALGNLSRFIRFTTLSDTHNEPVALIGSNLTNFNISDSPQTSRNVAESTSLRNFHWLERMVQAFVSCVTTGNVKVQWNVCHALSSLFLNATLRLQDMAWAPSVFSILLLLLRDSSNFKIRIHAAAALAVPASRLDYGSSFSDVVQGLEHVLETLGSDHISDPSSFKYRDALQKQLTSTTLHVLGLASGVDHQPLKDFLVKKASFLEDWLKSLCSPEVDATSSTNQKDGSSSSSSSIHKKAIITKTIKSLVEVYEHSNHHSIAQRFEKLIDCIS